MKKIHKLVLKSYLGPLVLTFIISLFVLLMQFLWKWVEDFVGKGLDWSIIANILFYASAGLVPMALPLAVLLASVMTFGNFGEYYELTAMKTSGISLLKVMRPLIFLTIFISSGAFYFSNNVLPYTNLKIARLLFDVTRKRPELNIKTGVFNNEISGYSIKVNKKNQETGMMYDFMIYNHVNKIGNKEVILADSGHISVTNDRKNMVITLYNGHNYTEMQERSKTQLEYPFRKDKFDEQTIIFELTDFDYKESNEGLFKSNYQMMNLKQLTNAIDTLNGVYKSRTQLFRNRLIAWTYTKYEHKINVNDTAEFVKDSIKKYVPVEKLVINFDVDSLYQTLNNKEKKLAASSALESATKTYDNIKTTGKALQDRQRWIKKHKLAWYRKFSLSFACIIFFFIGAPLGAIIKKGGFGLPIVISTLLFIFYYIVSIMGEKFVSEGILPAVIGAWLSSAILFPIGVLITYKAARDSQLISREQLTTIINKITSFFKLLFG